MKKMGYKKLVRISNFAKKKKNREALNAARRAKQLNTIYGADKSYKVFSKRLEKWIENKTANDIGIRGKKTLKNILINGKDDLQTKAGRLRVAKIMQAYDRVATGIEKIHAERKFINENKAMLKSGKKLGFFKRAKTLKANGQSAKYIRKLEKQITDDSQYLKRFEEFKGIADIKSIVKKAIEVEGKYNTLAKSLTRHLEADAVFYEENRELIIDYNAARKEHNASTKEQQSKMTAAQYRKFKADSRVINFERVVERYNEQTDGPKVS